MIRLNELFVAPQGEGPNVGREAVFVRVHGCPVHCAWCDTAYTWNGSEHGEAVDGLLALGRVRDLAGDDVAHVVLTGGEPMVSRGAPSLVAALETHGYHVEIETSGHTPLSPAWRAVLDAARPGRVSLNISPKMPSAAPKIAPDPELLVEYAQAAGEHARYKVVIADDADWSAWLLLWSEVRGRGITSDRVWVMPQARTAAELATATRWLIDRSARSGFRVSPRQHVLAFGEERGR